MPPSRRETYDWYEDTDALEAPRGLTTVPGNTASLRQFSWWLAAIAFLGDMDGRDLESCSTWASPKWARWRRILWALILALGICYGIYNFSKSQSRPLAHLLCVVSAVVLLLNHALGS